MECIDKLNFQIDQFESEIESVCASSKKKKLDRDVSSTNTVCLQEVIAICNCQSIFQFTIQFV